MVKNMYFLLKDHMFKSREGKVCISFIDFTNQILGQKRYLVPHKSDLHFEFTYKWSKEKIIASIPSPRSSARSAKRTYLTTPIIERVQSMRLRIPR
jgi:hypothetical protein